MKTITRQKLARWLEDLAREQMVQAPTVEEGVLLYRPMHSSEAISWEFTRPVMSIKEMFFPATERLMTVEKKGEDILLREVQPTGKQLIFGVRPCDARGLLALDALFLDSQPVDSYYAARREQTTLIGLACQEMGDSCFCTAVGGAPDDSMGMDIMLYEVGPSGSRYAVEAISARGRALVSRMPLQDLLDGERLPAKGRAANWQPLPMPELADWPPHFADAFWAETAERCLSCRACAYVCPTCRCFDVRDEPLPGENGQDAFERIRCWDSCTGQAYRRIAGGHNPRAAREERLRNRFFCKFFYYPEQYGPAACTGCGRCIDVCPVNIDITEVLAHLAASRSAAGVEART